MMLLVMVHLYNCLSSTTNEFLSLGNLQLRTRQNPKRSPMAMPLIRGPTVRMKKLAPARLPQALAVLLREVFRRPSEDRKLANHRAVLLLVLQAHGKTAIAMRLL